ncbi:hypothetical protein QAO71_17060 (plasmid) [Halopseudomonas sp. SMJS2]|uniref:hypothetical protein n=1 Tax=Halopseudomonas sp. SMJS2 TaxID=3041098 RepID=UPI002452D5B2|nr:hypothetical protein [Halopseudomonas sp. SMJS2]WGK63480.1 hypothetical protein QAO71_17060 [Halopseudomonas sp. SMJS2]
MALAHELDESWRADDGKFDIARWHVWARKHGLLPWQRTRKAYVAHLEPKGPIQERYGPFRSMSTFAMAACEIERLELKRIQMLAHERSVKQALERGEPVSQEVVADYPHLAVIALVSADVIHQ